jgi:glutathione S-transferase
VAALTAAWPGAGCQRPSAAPMPIAVYHGPPATRGVRPIWALEELGIPHDIISVDFSAEYRRTPEWRSINPVGKVPTMTDGELTMMESVAMVQYILDRYGGGRLQPVPGTPCVWPTTSVSSLCPSSLSTQSTQAAAVTSSLSNWPLITGWHPPVLRLTVRLSGREHALYLQWCHFAEATFARPLGEMTNHRREFDPPREEILREMALRGRLCVKALDEALSDGRPYILGDDFSAADICLGA